MASDLEKRKYLRLLQNPYAYHAVMGDICDEQPDVQVSGASQAARKTVSKATFRSEARRILAQYIPITQAGRLSTIYREFISRNESSKGERLYRLLDGLHRYDLSSDGLRSQFNRDFPLEIFKANRLV